MSFLLILAAFLIALIGTFMVRGYAIRRSILDIPNARSSHSVPVPRGGGVAIVVSYLICLLAFFLLDIVPVNTVWAMLGGGGAVAIVGFLDDRGHIAARWRLLAHFVCAGWAMAWLGQLPALNIGGVYLDLGWVSYIVAALFLVWMLNLYNFMDGIDGIASIQAISVGLGGAVMYYWGGYPNHSYVCLALASASAGFLVWNFPRARIFMGDAGSGFLGLVIGLITLQAAWVSIDYLWAFLILSAVFIVDATLTLFRRLWRGERVYQAHRSHAYQHAARYCASHLPVTLGVLAINLFWILPWALVVGWGRVNSGLGLCMAYLPLVLLAVKLGAGAPEAVPIAAVTKPD